MIRETVWYPICPSMINWETYLFWAQLLGGVWLGAGWAPRSQIFAKSFPYDLWCPRLKMDPPKKSGLDPPLKMFIVNLHLFITCVVCVSQVNLIVNYFSLRDSPTLAWTYATTSCGLIKSTHCRPLFHIFFQGLPNLKIIYFFSYWVLTILDISAVKQTDRHTHQLRLLIRCWMPSGILMN